MDCEHYQTVDSPKREPRVGRGLFGVHVSTNSSHQILIFQIREIFLNLTYSLRKNISFSKCPKTQNCHKLGDLELLETWPRFRQKGRSKQPSYHAHSFQLLFIHWWRGSSLEMYGIYNTFSRNNEYLLTFLIEKTLRNTVFFSFCLHMYPRLKGSPILCSQIRLISRPLLYVILKISDDPQSPRRPLPCDK